ncbi:MAG: endonuclease/exonuclease/phosphatase family protein [Clostridia bacterium]|nr:endonuclease/exonuclease/phosphatase family protein [Clostridia bacterium]
MKHIRNLLPLLLVAAMLLTAPACGKGDVTNTDTSAESHDSADAVSTATTEPAAPEQKLALVEGGKSAFKIIYPEGSGSELMAEITDMVQVIRDYTGATIFYNDDFTRQSQEELSALPEILIGATNRAESAKVVGKELRYGEFVMAIEGNKLILGGPNENASIAAVRYFVNTFLYKNEELTKGDKSGTILFSESDSYRFERRFKIEEMTVSGVPISEFCFTVPENGYVETYVAQLIARYITKNHGETLPILTEAEAAGQYEHLIRVGNLPGADKSYAIRAKDGNLEVDFDNPFLAVAAYEAVVDDILRPVSGKVELVEGELFRGATVLSPYDVLDSRGDVRILYHNIWGYLNTDGSNPVSMRADIAIPIYDAIAPEILCFEEAGTPFRTEARPLFKWLKAENYSEICFTNEGGTGNPIFYRKDLLELLDSGYAKSRNGDKGTTWAIFRLKSDANKVFAVTNSHFAANSNAGGDAELGNTYRVQDAKAALQAIEGIFAKYPNVPIFVGGDFNTNPSGDPYRTLQNGGLVNVRTLTENQSGVRPYHGSYAYDKEFDLYEPVPGAAAGTAGDSIDHIMTVPGGATILRQYVMDDMLSATVSDHCPHFVDVVLP